MLTFLGSGVFNVLHGDGSVGSKLVSNQHLSKISFTGSVPTGQRILAISSKNVVPATMELGGKSPLIIFEDCNDLDSAVQGAVAANFYAQGEVCSNATRIFVHENILVCDKNSKNRFF